MAASEIGKAEGVVQALLDYLVDPMLPVKLPAAPSLLEQQSVARQVHAVVLLYNYYHRKKYPKLGFLDFESFCKLACSLKPALMAHMKLMKMPDNNESGDAEKQLSLAEKAVMNACVICQVLDASKDVPETEGWPISKVSVLLIDFKKENCVLQFGSITKGAWSLIEKDIDISNDNSEGKPEAERLYKKRRVLKKPSTHVTNGGESCFLKHAYSAVKGVTGIGQNDVSVLESHIVYSLSKKKTAAHFFIMQCNLLVNKAVTQVPLTNVIDSLLGPLVRQGSCGQMVTPVVEYFHILPYAAILENWFSRKVLSNGEKASTVVLENLKVDGSQMVGNHCVKELDKIRDEFHSRSGIVGACLNETIVESPKEKDHTRHSNIFLADSFIKPEKMDVDGTAITCHQNAGMDGIFNKGKVEQVAVFSESDPKASKSDVNVELCEIKDDEGPEQAMHSLDVGPAEDAVQAFLNFLVDPVLPEKLSAPPSLLEEQLVARQVRAAVLLYNYYHRKKHPQLEFLGFIKLCKLAGILKPSLIAHMKFMQMPDDTEMDDAEKQLSPTEKAIMEACDVSQSLDASKDVPKTEGWPISKVSVFLIDSKKERCFLILGSITEGVWSVIEKDVDMLNGSSEGKLEATYKDKRKRILKKPLRNGSNVDDSCLLQHAYSAVKGITGMSDCDLLVLESHVVYSLSKEKTATRFYIMQCKASTCEEVIKLPLSYMIDRLQGPLVRRSSGGWMVTPVVEYFHVLPYAGILTNWFSREVLSNKTNRSLVGLENLYTEDSQRIEKPSVTEMNKIRCKSNGKSCIDDTSMTESTTDAPDINDIVGHSIFFLPITSTGLDRVDADNTAAAHEYCKGTDNAGQVEYHHEQITSPVGDDLNASAADTKFEVEKIGAMTSYVSHCSDEQLIITGSKHSKTTLPERDMNLRGNAALASCQCKTTTPGICSMSSAEQFEIPVGNCVPVTCQSVSRSPGVFCEMASQNQNEKPSGSFVPVTCDSSTKSLGNIQSHVARKDDLLLKLALRIVLGKIDKLRHQLCIIEDEIAKCYNSIQTIITGSEGEVALNFESIVEGCGALWPTSVPQNQNCTDQLRDNEDLLGKRKRLSEAILTVQNPCQFVIQELDRICYGNNWLLPTYEVSLKDGGYQVGITVKGMDFEFSIVSELHASLNEARKSVAAQMLTKLRTKGHCSVALTPTT